MMDEMMKKTCRCCGYVTLESQIHDICGICWWQDDPNCWDDPDFIGGANGISLREAQRNFLEFGACEKVMLDLCRPPQEDEKDPNWKPFHDEPQMSDDEEYISTGELAKLIGTNEQTVRKMFESGKLKTIKPSGTHWKIPKSQLEAIKKFNSTLLKLNKKIGKQYTDEELESQGLQ